MPASIEYLKPSQVELFGKALCNKLLSKEPSVIKSYINLLVEEVLMKEDTANIKGSYEALAHVMHQMKMGTNNLVPTFIPNWCRLSDSN